MSLIYSPGSKGGSRRTSYGSKRRSSAGGDRFIPSRSATDMELGHTRVVKSRQAVQTKDCAQVAEEYNSVLQDNLFQGSPSKSVLVYSSPLKGQQKRASSRSARSPSASSRAGLLNSPTSIVRSPKRRGRKAPRKVSDKPERILDAPDIVDDYYLNLLDWGKLNVMAIALASKVYLWNAVTGEVHQLLDTEDEENVVTSLSFCEDGTMLAVGTAHAELELWDLESMSFLRELPGHLSRIGSLSWNPKRKGVLCSGSRDASIFHHDVRIARHCTGTFMGHSQEVCGLRWSLSGDTLASGGNDNKLLIWDGASATRESCPRFQFDQHVAAVKALSWCPFKDNLLASGGGTADRCIRFWNTSTGVCVNSIDTASQVCALQWSKHYHELVSSHGFSQNQLILWNYPSMTKVAELRGHRSRVLHMASSPDGQTLVSAASDETVRFWKIFPTPSIIHSEIEKRRHTRRGWRPGTGTAPLDIR